MKRIHWRALPRALCMCVLSALMLFPFYWMCVTSFKTTREMSVYPPTLLPDSFQTGNYAVVLNHSSLGIFFRNSILTALVETTLVMLITVTTAFALYRARFRGKRVLFTVLLLLHALPFEVIMIFVYRMMIRWHLNDTLIALVLPFCFNFMYVYILYNAFKTIPPQVYLSASLDGASQLKFLLRIALPHARPTLIYIAIMNTVGCWNSFVWPMMITNSLKTRTLPFGLYAYMTETGARTELIMAMSVLSQLPMILLIVTLRKYFVNAYRSRNA